MGPKRPPEAEMSESNRTKLSRWLAELWRQRAVEFLKKHADALPSPDQELASKKWIRYCRIRLREGSSWRISKQIVEVRVIADDRMRILARCERYASRVDPRGELPPALATALKRAFGKSVSTFREAQCNFAQRRIAWQNIVSKARQVRNPVFAFHVFFRLSEHSRLEIASLVIAGLIVSGAVRMLFFYMAAAKQSVYAYWVWDDLIIQAINVVPLALLGLVISEALFRVAWLLCEKAKRPGLVLFVLHHPTSFALSFLVSLMLGASFLGHHQGITVWQDFKENGGTQSATMLDRTYLADVHLVGTTSRTAVFLRKEASGKLTRHAPRYRESLRDVACVLPFPRSWCEDKAKDGGYLVYVMDRDKILCHADAGQCESIPPVPSSGLSVN